MTVQGRAALTRWLAFHKANPQAGMRLFCFPYAGSGAVVYRDWQARLPHSIEVCPVQPPGRGGRLAEPPYTRLMPLVEEVVDALRPMLDRPYAFFGHSMGAMIAYEATRALRRLGAPAPLRLFVSGRRAPHLPATKPPSYDLPEPEFIEHLRELNGTPPEVLEHPELMRLLLPLLRADFEVVQTYEHEPGEPLGCPLTAFGGLRDEEATREEIEQWCEHTSGPFRMHMLPGDHFFLHSSQQSLLATLSQELGLLAR